MKQRDFFKLFPQLLTLKVPPKLFSRTGSGTAGVSPAPQGFQWPFAGSLFPVPGFPAGVANTVVMLPSRGEM